MTKWAQGRTLKEAWEAGGRNKLWSLVVDLGVDGDLLRLTACELMRNVRLRDGRQMWDALTDKARHMVLMSEMMVRGKMTHAEVVSLMSKLKYKGRTDQCPARWASFKQWTDAAALYTTIEDAEEAFDKVTFAIRRAYDHIQPGMMWTKDSEDSVHEVIYKSIPFEVVERCYEKKLLTLGEGNGDNH